MLRMVICCGGGMSSSVISVQIKKAIEDKGWEDEISVAPEAAEEQQYLV